MKKIITFSSMLLVTSCASTDWNTLVIPNEESVGHMLATSGVSYEKDDLLTQTGTIELPDSVRPCCAFGNEQSVELVNVKVPFFQLPNTVEYTQLGPHIYGAGQFSNRINEKNGERQIEGNGILYTKRGGFIDLAHVRDTADNTIGLFYKIYPKLGTDFTIDLSSELGERQIEFKAFDIDDMNQKARKEMSIELASLYAFRMAMGHEVSQWHGYRSFPLFSELVSAYSPEDLYSNMLGAKLSAKLLTDDLSNSVSAYNRNMSAILDVALNYLEPLNKEETAKAFEALDGTWWDSQTPIPQKYMVLKRNYNLTATQTPFTIDLSTLTKEKADLIQEDFKQQVAPQVLSLTQQYQGVNFNDFSKLTMKIDKKYLGSFAHIPKSLYPDQKINAVDYLKIATYDEAFDKKEYKAWADEKNN